MKRFKNPLRESEKKSLNRNSAFFIQKEKKMIPGSFHSCPLYCFLLVFFYFTSFYTLSSFILFIFCSHFCGVVAFVVLRGTLSYLPMGWSLRCNHTMNYTLQPNEITKLTAWEIPIGKIEMFFSPLISIQAGISTHTHTRTQKKNGMLCFLHVLLTWKAFLFS